VHPEHHRKDRDGDRHRGGDIRDGVGQAQLELLDVVLEDLLDMAVTPGPGPGQRHTAESIGQRQPDLRERAVALTSTATRRRPLPGTTTTPGVRHCMSCAAPAHYKRRGVRPKTRQALHPPSA